MEKLMVIDSCMKKGSRTRRILRAAMEVLSGRYDVETVDVNALALPPVTPETLAERSSGVVPEETVAVARRIAPRALAAAALLPSFAFAPPGVISAALSVPRP